MFSKLAVFATLFVALAAATPTPLADGPKCNTGTLQCCDNIQNANSAGVQGILGILNIPVQNVNGQVGVNCNPITVIGALQGTSCKNQPACCDANQLGGILSTGCVPVNIL
ncbi:hydrophobin [Trametes polyzona]|nr:hydrophobin [Trametes polyzona]